MNVKPIIKTVIVKKDELILGALLDCMNKRLVEIMKANMNSAVKKDMLRDLLNVYEHELRMKAVKISINFNKPNVSDAIYLSRLPVQKVCVLGVEYATPSEAAWMRDESIIEMLNKLDDPANGCYAYVSDDETDAPAPAMDENEAIMQLEKDNIKYRKLLQKKKHKIAELKALLDDEKVRFEFYRVNGRDMTEDDVPIPVEEPKRSFKEYPWDKLPVSVYERRFADVYRAAISLKMTNNELKDKILDEAEHHYRITDFEVYHKLLELKKKHETKMHTPKFTRDIIGWGGYRVFAKGKIYRDVYQVRTDLGIDTEEIKICVLDEDDKDFYFADEGVHEKFAEYYEVVKEENVE